ncbi:MAG: GNAT family N-acetyltransferase [Chitinophagaceae bacterium]
MEEITIRKASPNDIDTLLLFEQAVINAERPFDQTIKSGPTNYYNMQELITAPHIELVVAQLGDQLIGSGYARIENAKPFLQHSQHAYLGFMYVDGKHRGKGINKMIIDSLKKWALSKGMTELRLDVYIENIAAVKAYERAGFSELMIEMRMGLE